MTTYTIVDRDEIIDHLGEIVDAFNEHDENGEIATEVDAILQKIASDLQRVDQPIHLEHTDDHFELTMNTEAFPDG